MIGAAGFVAPRHMEAIKQTQNNLLVAMDPSDSVGVIDSYFPNAAFFTEFERFDRHIFKEKEKGNKIDYLSICTPNYLHDAHIRYGLRINSNVICEKPLVLNPWNLDALEKIESDSNNKVNTILQLRLHPNLQAIKSTVPKNGKKEVSLTYITSRGNWYYASWKGEDSKSGGILTNIGIHFFDALIWLFGKVQNYELNQLTHDRASGILELEDARVKWFLSINEDTLPLTVKEKGATRLRSLTIGDQDIDISSGFENLHILSYEKLLQGDGFNISDARPSIELTYKLRNAKVRETGQGSHPFAQLPLSRHPFEVNR